MEVMHHQTPNRLQCVAFPLPPLTNEHSVDFHMAHGLLSYSTSTIQAAMNGGSVREAKQVQNYIKPDMMDSHHA